MSGIEERTVEAMKMLRRIYPAFELEKIVDGLEDTLKDTGLIIKYASMEDIERDNKTGPLGGYAYADKWSRLNPVIVLNGNDDYFERRLSLAHLTSTIIRQCRWKPFSPSHGVPTSGAMVYDKNNNDKGDRVFAHEMLLPKDRVIEFLDSPLLSGSCPIVRRHLILSILSGAYKVPERMVSERLDFVTKSISKEA